MLFNSYIFILIFFPLCISGFYLLDKLQTDVYAKLWLIGLSLWFYGYFNVYYLAIMVLSICVNHVLTIWIMWITKKDDSQSHNFEWQKRLPLIVGIVINLSVLFYFKYFDFFLTAVNDVFGTGLALRNILLPLGISFFTFQQIGFLVDVYNGEITDVTFVDYALFVSFFPQLIAGPIVSWSEMFPQFESIQGRKADSEKISRGLTLFILGLSKKVLIADLLGKAVDAGYDCIGVIGGLDSFLVMIWYALQLYFDFSGYCDMARGLARMLGFELPVNFDSPYKSKNIVEFWKRWHITLTRFFTKYVYIPLGGNRRGEIRMLINILIIYFLSGIWHGAGYNYILWGMLHGVLYVATRVWLGRVTGNRKTNKITNAIKNILTFIYVSFAWVYFRASSIHEGTMLIGNIFTGSWRSVSYPLSEVFKGSKLWYCIKVMHFDRYPFSQNLLMICITIGVLAMTFALPNASYIADKLKPKRRYAVLIAMLGMWCLLTLSEVSTFLYFNF